MRKLFVILISFILFNACNSSDNSATWSQGTSIDGYYELISGNDKCMLTISGSSWSSKCVETTWDQTIVSGNGTVQGNKLLGEYGNEVGSVSGSSVTVNISGSGITMYKQ